MGTTVRLTAESKYGYSGQYIARITGRQARVQFARTFVGSKSGKRNESTSFETDETGLYEECDVSKSGKSKSYALVLPWKQGIRKVYADLEDSLIIAKRLDAGEPLESIVKLELGEQLFTDEWYRVCSECDTELALVDHCYQPCPNHPDTGSAGIPKTRKIPRRNDDGSPIHALVYRLVAKEEPPAPQELPPELSALESAAKQELAMLVMNLAFAIEDPCGQEAIQLARKVVETFQNRNTREIESMSAALSQWALGWPRKADDNHGG